MLLTAEAPLVSIVVPTFNQGRYLAACIDHCLFQTYPNLEIIIVDGGSTDETKNYLSKLGHEIEHRTLSPVAEMNDAGEIVREQIRVYPRDRTVKPVVFKENLGATRTYNEGLSRVTGSAFSAT